MVRWQHKMKDRTFDIAKEISRSVNNAQVFLVGIDGPGGAGKSFLAEKICHRLEALRFSVAIVHFDDFFLPSANRCQLPVNLRPIGSDFDWIRLRDQVLMPLRACQLANYTRYDWPSDRLAENHEIPPKGIAIIEGVYSTRVELRDLFDFRIWVDCPGDLRLNRGIARDGEAIRSRWIDEWAPAEDRYFSEQRPHVFAHIVVDGAAT